MGKRFEKLSEADRAFIAAQHLFFIASASKGGEVNLSPRGYDVFRVVNANEALFLDYAGSGNRTARDIENDGEVTLLFCAFEGAPLNLRLFCKGELVDKNDPVARSYFRNTDFTGMRRFIRLTIYCVEHSCGMSVPRYDYVETRETLREWCVDGEREGRLDAYSAKHDTPPDLSEFRARVL